MAHDGEQSHYRSNVRDQEFLLLEVLGRDRVLGAVPYEDLDVDTARSVLAEVDRLARTKLAASYVESDRNPPVYDPATRSVTTSEPFKQSFSALMDAEWFRLQLPVGLGGQPTPPSLQWAVAELMLGANPAAFFYAAGPNFAHAIWRNGTPAQQRIAEIMIERRWGATMVLTEPDAGSDVGAGRTRARPNPDGTWHVEGVKRFITSGEWDWPENIVHFVLARPEGVPGAGGPGTKGLSLFLVPKIRFDLETGELGERNGVYATNLEHKMGLKASATTELTFGAEQPAVGYLLGDVHDGIRQMFEIIEYARMLVGTKAMAALSTGYLHALEFSKERIQGGDLADPRRSGPRIPIIEHPDVRRQLMALKTHAEGLRALVLYAAAVQDDVAIARAAGRVDEDAVRLNDLLLPVVKGYGSERAYALLSDALQVHGGSGYLQDYPIEQYLRDAKIDTLYEGTTAIQGIDLFFRKMVRDNFQAVTALGAEIQSFVKADPGDAALSVERELLGRALEDVQGIITAMGGFLAAAQVDRTATYQVGQNTTRLLLAVGDLLVGWLLLRSAEAAIAALADLDAADGVGEPGRAGDRAFYQGKIAGARWFAREVLTRLAVERALAEATDNAVMDLPADAF